MRRALNLLPFFSCLRARTLGWVALLILMAGCSTLQFGYGQLPRLAAWQLDGYLDLDSAQRRQLDAALAELHAWHRREELPRARAVLVRADSLWGESASGRGVTADELDALEQETTAAVSRLLMRAEPLARPLLSSLRPAQWEHLRQRQRERLDEWLELEGDPEERADRFVDNLERWLGSLERPLRQMARAEVARWPVRDREDLRQLWQARQQRIVDGLRAVAAGQREQGLALLASLSSEPVDPALSEAVRASVLRVLNAATPAQRAQARERWARWHEDLRQLETLQTAQAVP
ncbi:hypothetical protein AZ34_10870 [Hylemonella gracilis str. Niagara R]|uniref:Lipoprotein n=1 Tax=Hylemonella gracilis str. Niagara R TaxID=1458275 RepID=A0A016XM11_9BURK|nr:DUF6279 family lipoprotein [Hylemonella gracilis]EYC52881.1 hypothetical protein AZ34_10870 [Hylemonella gracilis str. Niagara R]